MVISLYFLLKTLDHLEDFVYLKKVSYFSLSKKLCVRKPEGTKYAEIKINK